MIEQVLNKKKQSIIEATIDLFMKQSVRKTTLEDIARNADASKVTVYKYFKDKDALQLSICRCLITRYLNQLIQESASQTSLSERMTGFMRIMSEFIGSGHQDLCIELGTQSIDSGKEYALFKDKIRHMMLALIDEGKKEHLIYSDINNEVLYHYINMGLCYFQHDASYRERVQYDADFRKSFLSLIWRNIYIHGSPAET